MRLPADAGASRVPVSVREASLEEVRPLRHRVLRAGKPFSATISADDRRPEMRHLAACAGDTIVGAVSYFPQMAPHDVGVPAVRFRGMAVDAEWQGRGVGTALMRELRNRARAAGAEMLWANGRDSAQSFYLRLGFDVVGDMFLDHEMHIPHHVVAVRLDALRV